MIGSKDDNSSDDDDARTTGGRDDYVDQERIFFCVKASRDVQLLRGEGC